MLKLKCWENCMKKIVIFFCAVLLCNPVFSANVQNINAGADVSKASILMPYKDISLRWHVINKMKKQTKNLSEDDKSVIKKYVFGAVKGEDTFLLINCYLRGNLQNYIPKKEITTPLKCRLDYYANALAKPISKTKLPQNIILYRGIDNKGIKQIFKDKDINTIADKPVNETNLALLKQKLDGAYYIEKGFMSTSYNKNCAKKTTFRFELNAPKNLQAVLIEDIGKQVEKEVLVNRGTKWEVTDIRIEKDKNTKKDFYMIKAKFIKE